MVSSAAVPTVSAGFVGGNRTHGSTGGAGDGASYGCWFTAALGKPGDMSSSRPAARHLACSLPNVGL